METSGKGLTTLLTLLKQQKLTIIGEFNIASDWYQNLITANWPEVILLLDFETFFSKEYHLGKDKTAISLPEYVADSRFEFTGLGIQVFNHPLESKGKMFVGGPSVKWMIGRLQKHFGKFFQNCTCVAKNTKFDFLILAEKFGIFPAFPLDIEDLSRYIDSRLPQSLDKMLKRANLPCKGDTKQFRGQHWNEMDHATMKKYCLGDIQGEGDLLKRLLPIIDNPAFELDLMRHTLNLFTRPKLKLDYELAGQLADDMEAEVHNVTAGVAKYFPPDISEFELIKFLRTRKKFPAMLQLLLGDEQLPTKKGKKEIIPALAKTDEGCAMLLVHKKQSIRDLIAAKLAITSWPTHAKKLRRMITWAKCTNDLLRIFLKYYGAHTARWSGGGGVNPQNFGGKGRGKPIHPLIAKVRNCLLAPEYHTLAIVDSAQIEARMLAWIAGCDTLLTGFANGEDIYSEFAAGLFNSRVWKPAGDDDSLEAKVAGVRRGFGKDAILGCGYGMGANKFYMRCRENDSLRPLFDSGEYSFDFIKKLIKVYRTTYPGIPKFWSAIEKAFKWVVKYPNQTSKIAGGRIKIWRERSMVCCRLPSGRVLYYRHVTLDTKGDLKYMGGLKTVHTWGGALTENVVQAMARDLLGYWTLEFEKGGYPIVLHAHDEDVACIPEQGADEVLNRMLEIMRVSPVWADGVPLDAEGELSRYYKK